MSVEGSRLGAGLFGPDGKRRNLWVWCVQTGHFERRVKLSDRVHKGDLLYSHMRAGLNMLVIRILCL